MSVDLTLEIAYFEENLSRLVKEHHREFALVHGQEEVGFFSSGGEAYRHAMEKGFEGKPFLIRQCLKPEEETPAVFHSRVA